MRRALVLVARQRKILLNIDDTEVVVGHEFLIADDEQAVRVELRRKPRMLTAKGQRNNFRAERLQ